MLFPDYLNGVQPRIQFTMEKEDVRTWPLLMCWSSKSDKGFSHTVNRKPSHTDRFFHRATGQKIVDPMFASPTNSLKYWSPMTPPCRLIVMLSIVSERCDYVKWANQTGSAFMLYVSGDWWDKALGPPSARWIKPSNTWDQWKTYFVECIKFPVFVTKYTYMEGGIHTRLSGNRW